MKKSLLALAVQAACFAMIPVARRRTLDVAFTYRMGAGFPGDVNRFHPASIVPGLMNSTVQAPRLFGDAVIIDTATNSYRGLVAADGSATAAAIDGVVVRPYPTQQTTGGLSAVLGGGGVPSPNQPVDVISDGFVMVTCNVGTPTKGGAAYVWCATSTGSHVQGGFEAAATGTSTMQVTNAFFNGPPDASGVTELRVTASKI